MTLAAETDTARALHADLVSAVGDSSVVDSSERRRAEYGSDASNYRVSPLVVAYPRDAADMEAALGVARTHGVALTMRGAGTSVAGNAIGPGIVLDTSVHMNRILDVDLDARTARVEPGVVLSTLQNQVASAGLRFGPDPSTSTRATLGGMIGNNACGPHAVAYGKTAQNVRALDVIDGRGRAYSAGQGLESVPGLQEIVAANLATIRTQFGTFGRQVSGYSLEHLLPENGADLAKFLVGTEGTLGLFSAATLDLVPVAPSKLTIVLGYDDMPAAADAVVPLLACGPDALEGIDARLVARVAGAGRSVPDLPPGAGWLLVEVGAATADEARAKADAIVSTAGTGSAQIVDDAATAARIWAIRADGAGLAGRSADNVESWPGWEDAAVPPAQLGAYLRDFDALMDSHGISGQPFGHFGDGCIHVRLTIPMRESGAPLRAFMEDAADLVHRYGGSLSGEHGDGRARSELLPRMYSPEAIDLFAQVKTLFDPEDVLNPGIITAPTSWGAAAIDADLRRPQAPATPANGGFAFADDHGDMTEAVHRCTGVGKCRADSGGFMCPSYRATKDEKDVTRGRARVLQDALAGHLDGGLSNPAVLDSLEMCLACKACSSDCPSGVDMAAFKSETLNRRYRGKVRPRLHYTLGWLPRWLPLVGLMPRLASWGLNLPVIRDVAKWTVGMDTKRNMMTFSTPFNRTQPAKLRRGTVDSSTATRRVVLWADSFSNGMAPDADQAMLEVLEAAGFDVTVVAGDACCGVSWITTGQLDGARKRQQHLLSVLGPFAVNGIPIIGVEPSCTATLRSDLVELNHDDPRAHAVAQMTFTLSELLTGRAPVAPAPEWTVPDLSGVTAVAQPHCHQYSVSGWAADRELLTGAGATLVEAEGCCGVAGTWGMEKGHYEVSVQVAEHSLLPNLREAPEGAIYLADGVSCRTQGADLAGIDGLHLAQLIRSRLG